MGMALNGQAGYVNGEAYDLRVEADDLKLISYDPGSEVFIFEDNPYDDV